MWSLKSIVSITSTILLKHDFRILKHSYKRFLKTITKHFIKHQRKIFSGLPKSTLCHAPITVACPIHQNIMARVSYLQHEQLRWALRSVNTNTVLTKYMSWMNVKLWFIINTFKNIFFYGIPYVYVPSARDQMESQGLQGPRLPRSITFIR